MTALLARLSLLSEGASYCVACGTRHAATYRLRIGHLAVILCAECKRLVHELLG